MYLKIILLNSERDDQSLNILFDLVCLDKLFKKPLDF